MSDDTGLVEVKIEDLETGDLDMGTIPRDLYDQIIYFLGSPETGITTERPARRMKEKR